MNLKSGEKMDFQESFPGAIWFRILSEPDDGLPQIILYGTEDRNWWKTKNRLKRPLGMHEIAKNFETATGFMNRL